MRCLSDLVRRGLTCAPHAQVSGWEDRMKITTPLFIATTATSHDPFTHASLITELYNYTGATATMVEDSEYCTVMTLRWPGFEGWEFKYVNNKMAPVGDYTLEDYDKYIENVHLDYISQSSKDGGSWFNW